MQIFAGDSGDRASTDSGVVVDALFSVFGGWLFLQKL